MIEIEVNDERCYPWVGWFERYHGAEVSVSLRGEITVDGVDVDQRGGWTAPVTREERLIAGLAEVEAERDLDDLMEQAHRDAYEDAMEARADMRREEGR